jgi:hypothetical protein
MASRLPFPNDPQMRMEEALTLLRKSSNQAKPNGHTPDSSIQKAVDSTDEHDDHAPQRRRFVFTDPVAFRFVLAPNLDSVPHLHECQIFGR